MALLRLQRSQHSCDWAESRPRHHKQRVVCSLTEKAIELVPLMAVMGSWGLRYNARVDGTRNTCTSP
jgi:DNA-binding HxlR family transcriptional regulator